MVCVCVWGESSVWKATINAMELETIREKERESQSSQVWAQGCNSGRGGTGISTVAPVPPAPNGAHPPDGTPPPEEGELRYNVVGLHLRDHTVLRR